MSGELARTVGGPVAGTVTVTLPDPLPVSTTQLPPALADGRLVVDGSQVTQPVSVTSPLTAFGEVQVAHGYPVAQGEFIYGINTETWRTVLYGAGATVSSAINIASTACGTAANGYAVLQTRYSLVYRPGQGSLAMLTAIYAAPVTNNQQLAGAGNPESGYYFGYNGGATFGILHATGGVSPIQTLTITTKSSTAENVTVTLDGTPVLVAVTNGASTVTTAWEIARGNFSQAGQGWDAQAIDSVVYFVARQCNAPVGTVALAASTAIGVGAVVTAATAPTNTFIAQSAWNGDTLDGTGNSGNPSGMLLDPTKGNTYRIAFQYLGFGAAFFFVEDQTTGRFLLVHTIRNTNTRTSVVLNQPACTVRWISRNVGNTTSVAILGASAGAFVQGDPNFIGPRFSASASKAVTANILTPILSLMAMRSVQGRSSRVQVTLTITSFAGDGTRPVVFTLSNGATLTGTPNFVPVNLTASAVAVDTSATGVSGGTQIFGTNVSQTGNGDTDLTSLSFIMIPGDVFTITALSVANTTCPVTIAWNEN